MHDQADELRQLVQQVALAESSPSRPPRLVAVAGAKGGVGTTTIAVNLAVTLATMDHRVVLVDADTNGPDAIELCHRPTATSRSGENRLSQTFASENRLADVIAARKPIREALRPGPLGVRLLVSDATRDSALDWTLTGQNRLIDQLEQLSDQADLIVLDIGNGLGTTTHRFWQAADEVILVTTSEDVAIMDAYATIKNFAGSVSPTKLRVVMNGVVETSVASAAGDRLCQACQRFLGRELRIDDIIASDEEVTRAARNGSPLAVGPTTGPAGRAIEQLAGQLLTDLGLADPRQPSAVAGD